MAKSRVELLLNRTVENLGIVGDVVKVKAGFARNYLLPHRIAEHPTAERIESLKEARAKAQAELAKMRAERESLITRLDGVTIKLIRSCNDQGVLYGAVSQRDIADQLVTEGYGVDTRAVRLTTPIRRIGTYHCVIQFDRDLRSEIHIEVNPDRAIEAFTQQQAAEAASKESDAASDAEGEGSEESGESASAGGKDRAGKGEDGEKRSKGAKAAKGKDAAKGESQANSGR